MTLLTWIGILFCISQSAMFSGLNLAFFSISKLRLHAEVAQGNKNAQKVLDAREDTNFLLTTILWGNVGINVLLTLLSNSVMAGVFAFLFSSVVITLLGEIVPQAYFSRNALRMASLLLPLLKIYQIILYPLAKSTALFLDSWLGKEAIPYFRERDLEEIIKMHIISSDSEIDHVEGRGALNFLAMDDIPIRMEGVILDPASMIVMEFKNSYPVFPEITFSTEDAFLKKLQASGKKWLVLVDSHHEPGMVLDSDSFIRAALFESESFNPLSHCHRPIVFKNSETNLGELVTRLRVSHKKPGDDVIDEDIILYWSKEKRIITGADILGRLLRGIARKN